MKNYLSFGGGVNSVALYLLMQDMGIEFEAIFVDHGGDYPETYTYLKYFIATGRSVTVLTPLVGGCTSLWGYIEKYKMLPNTFNRWCTSKFKVDVINKNIKTPCFMHLGIDAGEIKRAKFSSTGGVENRYLLIEHDIDRQGCKDLIGKHGLSVPKKSGCYFCPYQRVSQWRMLRKNNPELFCKVQKMEQAQIERRAKVGKKPFYLCNSKKPLNELIGGRDKQKALPGLEDLEYPPCQCGL